MLTKDEKDYLAKIPASKKVSVQSFDSKAKKTGDLIISKIKKKLPELDVLFMGATALGIAGQNDIDIYALSNSKDLDKHLPKLKQLFGNPKNIHKTFVEWEFSENGYPVELYLTEPPKKQIKVFEILKSDKKLLKEYEDLKLSFDRKSFRDYQKAKYEFYNKILKQMKLINIDENTFNYKQFYNRVGKRIGWDFSRLGKTEEGRKWEFFEEVSKKAKPTDNLLDIGTGGGEQVLKVANKVQSVTGIDHSVSMVSTARKNLKKTRYKNVRFLQMNALDLKFPDNFFDIVTDRHCSFSTNEVYRVLKKGGYFFTQQVSEADKLNIKNAFGRGQAYKVKDGTLKKKYLKEMKKVGFRRVKSFDYNATVYYKTSEDLVFLLKYTPIIPEFGKNEKDFKVLEKFIEENMTVKGIKTNSKRFMISATCHKLRL